MLPNSDQNALLSCLTGEPELQRCRGHSGNAPRPSHMAGAACQIVLHPPDSHPGFRSGSSAEIPLNAVRGMACVTPEIFPLISCLVFPPFIQSSIRSVNGRHTAIPAWPVPVTQEQSLNSHLPTHFPQWSHLRSFAAATAARFLCGSINTILRPATPMAS